MKNYKLYIGLLAISSMAITSCKNDLKVLAPGDESVSIYGILNPSARTQNIRINKVYLTDGDAVVAGQDANTINYGPGELTVTLEHYLNGNQISVMGYSTALTSSSPDSARFITLKENVITTQAGLFSQEQRNWYTTRKIYPTGEYKLIVKHGDVEFTAQNIMVDSVRTISSQPSMPFIYNPSNPNQFPMHGGYPANPISTDKPKYVNYDNPNISYNIPFYTVANAKLYDLVIRFHYIDSIIGGGANAEYVDFTFPTFKSSDLNGGEKITAVLDGKAFYDNLATEISKKTPANLKNRRSHYLEYIITAGAESLSEFLQVNAPSTTIAQDKPYYTNINGGVGIFSCKARSTVTKDMWADMVDRLACYPSTQPLKLCNFTGVPSIGTCP